MRKLDLGFEPTLILNAIAAVAALLVTFQFDGLSKEQAGLIVAAISAGFALVNSLAVRPVAPALFTGFVAAVAAVVNAYGFNLSPEVVAGINGLILAVLPIVFREQVTPTPRLADAA
jgi:mannose/fructose/N-acetylgalactosamine-specific phosphotransferase system component IIC